MRCWVYRDVRGQQGAKGILDIIVVLQHLARMQIVGVERLASRGVDHIAVDGGRRGIGRRTSVGPALAQLPNITTVDARRVGIVSAEDIVPRDGAARWPNRQ